MRSLVCDEVRPPRLLVLALVAVGACAGGGSSGQPGDGGGPSSSSSSSGGGGSGGSSSGGATSGTAKRGVAYGFRSVNDLHALEPQMGWWYDWAYRPDAGVAGDAGAEFVPMVWGGSFDDAAVRAGIPAGARYLLGFNEPNFKSQANLSAADAAKLWPRLEAIADARGLELVSPAVNYCGPAKDCWDTDPVAYLDHFFAACTGCRVDAIAIHSYMCQGTALRDYLARFAKYGKPIWLTEFSCGDASDVSLAVQERYMQDAVALLEADPGVARYAWFIGRQNPANPSWPIDLLGADGTLTALGREYVGLPAAAP